MRIEFHPVGYKCNLNCLYCYQNLHRDVETPKFDPLILEQICDEWKGKGGKEVNLHGGEALLLPINELEDALEIIFGRFGNTGVQTNGTLITDRHIELFKKFKTHVGISSDGPGRCSFPRWGENEKDEILVDWQTRI